MTDKQMVDYLIDCTLATVESMVGLKRMSMPALKRQCAIAQMAINHLGIDYPFESRAKYFAKKKETALKYYSDYRERRLQ
jgi:hypothetical protein